MESAFLRCGAKLSVGVDQLVEVTHQVFVLFEQPFDLVFLWMIAQYAHLAVAIHFERDVCDVSMPAAQRPAERLRRVCNWRVKVTAPELAVRQSSDCAGASQLSDLSYVPLVALALTPHRNR